MAKKKGKPAKRQKDSKETRSTSAQKARARAAAEAKKSTQRKKRVSRARQSLEKGLVKALESGIRREKLDDAADAIERSARECVSFSLKARKRALALGASRFGGTPDMPSTATWPLSARGYLTFLAQINLSELPKLKGRPLPPSGWIYVFLGSDQSTSDVEHVIKYSKGRSVLEPRAAPAGTRVLPSFAATGKLACAIPGKGAPERKEWKFASRVSGRLRALRGRVGGVYPRLLGYPSCSVDDPRETAALIRDLRRRPFDLTWQSRNRVAVDAARAEWRHLFSLGSHKGLGVSFCHSGVLQVVIRRSDLKARSFSRTHACISAT
jgi:hypothetical protein